MMKQSPSMESVVPLMTGEMVKDSWCGGGCVMEEQSWTRRQAG